MNAVVQPAAKASVSVGSEPFDDLVATAPVPNERRAANEATNASPPRWIERLAEAMRANAGGSAASSPTALSCDLRARRPMLFLPPEMRARQPANLAWLRGFARRHGFGLAEERHRADAPPLAGRRGGDPDDGPGALALGIGRLLRQAGMPGALGSGACPVSSRHRPAAGPRPELDALVRMAAHARPRSKRVVLLPERTLVEAIGQDTHPIVAHACRLSTPTFRTVLSQFDSPSLRCIGYSSGRQYIVHVFLAGGRAASPELWTRLHTLTRTDFDFRLFPGRVPSEDFGLFHATFRYDVASASGALWQAVEAVAG